jgi:hypothetical protein
MTGEVEQVPERWRYLGRRETQSRRLGALWKTSDGEELLFNAKRPPKVVGATRSTRSRSIATLKR